MVDWNIILEWVKTNQTALILIGIAIVIAFVILVFIRPRISKRKTKQNISQEIYNRRSELRELDALLGELEGYFKKVETRMVRK